MASVYKGAWQLFTASEWRVVKPKFICPLLLLNICYLSDNKWKFYSTNKGVENSAYIINDSIDDVKSKSGLINIQVSWMSVRDTVVATPLSITP